MDYHSDVFSNVCHDFGGEFRECSYMAFIPWIVKKVKLEVLYSVCND